MLTDGHVQFFALLHKLAPVAGMIFIRFGTRRWGRSVKNKHNTKPLPAKAWLKKETNLLPICQVVRKDRDLCPESLLCR